MATPAQKSKGPLLICGIAGACLLAAHIYFNLGDYTAERGVKALAQTAALSGAFGAMVYLVLDATMDALSRLFGGDNRSD